MESPGINFEVSELIIKFLEKRLTTEEEERLQRWVDESEEHRQLWTKLTTPGYIESNLSFWRQQKPSRYWSRLQNEIVGKRELRRRSIQRTIKYAAVFIGILMLGVAAWYVVKQGTDDGLKNSLAVQSPETSTEILPQGKVAQLILGDGRSVNLRSTNGETIVESDGTKVHNDENMLQYAAGESEFDKKLFNTLIVPRGGEYRITLADGTKVWLNAASSLKYPTRFGKNERRVVLKGEGYFEVAKDANRPFWVEAGKAKVRVLGTKFNISAYNDDSKERIALEEGSVMVEHNDRNGDKAMLQPGYGAEIDQNKQGIWVHKVNLESVLSWKNAMFVFDDESLGSIMKKLSRWYNVDVKYEDGVDTRFHFTGRIQRYEDISNILKLIEMTNKVKFDVKDREVNVGLK